MDPIAPSEWSEFDFILIHAYFPHNGPYDKQKTIVSIWCNFANISVFQEMLLLEF